MITITLERENEKMLLSMCFGFELKSPSLRAFLRTVKRVHLFQQQKHLLLTFSFTLFFFIQLFWVCVFFLFFLCVFKCSEGESCVEIMEATHTKLARCVENRNWMRLWSCWVLMIFFCFISYRLFSANPRKNGECKVRAAHKVMIII